MSPVPASPVQVGILKAIDGTWDVFVYVDGKLYQQGNADTFEAAAWQAGVWVEASAR